MALMRYYRCKCGKTELVTADTPPKCIGCEICKTTLELFPMQHEKIREHALELQSSRRGDYMRCVHCGHSFNINGTQL